MGSLPLLVVLRQIWEQLLLFIACRLMANQRREAPRLLQHEEADPDEEEDAERNA